MSHLLSERVTPFVITFNEEANLERTLVTLRWARRVVVLDSGSTDTTAEIARGFKNVVWHVRPFDSFKQQCEFGILATGIETEYVLALDADMPLGEGLAEEIETHFLTQDYDGGVLGFTYCVAGQPLRGSLYPPQIRLFRRNKVEIEQAGHGHRFQVTGKLYHFRQRLLHDDRKTLERWGSEQLKYAALEAQRILNSPQRRWRDALRKAGVMPWLIGPYAYWKAGGPLSGAAAIRYAYERVTFESLLAIRLMSAKLGK